MSFSQSIRYMAGHALRSPSLQWRHHGIGVLQAYFHEGDQETRIHIWHPSLILPGFNETNGLIHDHRFSFDSYVLLGAIYNEKFGFYPNSEGEWVMHGVTHARKAMEETGSFHKALGVINDTCYSAVRMGSWHQTGAKYSMEARDFHMSMVQELTVTLVIKTGLVDGSAIIVGKKDVQLIHAFDHPKTDYVHLLHLASDRLLGIASITNKGLAAEWDERAG